jgi:putative transposase
VSVPDALYDRTRTGHGIEGVDVGVKTFAALSTGAKMTGPQAHRRALRRLTIRPRRLTRKIPAAKVSMGFAPQDPLPKGMRLPRSRHWDKVQLSVARTHRRITHIRQDFLHKLSTRLCRENQAVGIETLSVQGMLANHRLARAVADQGFGRFFSLLKSKARRYGTCLVEADRWFPSSQLCSTPGCGYLKTDLT